VEAPLKAAISAIESLRMQLAKIARNRSHFPNDEVASELLILATQYREKLEEAGYYAEAGTNQFAVLFGERFAIAMN
jgi:putative transposase